MRLIQTVDSIKMIIIHYNKITVMIYLNHLLTYWVLCTDILLNSYCDCTNHFINACFIVYLISMIEYKVIIFIFQSCSNTFVLPLWHNFYNDIIRNKSLFLQFLACLTHRWSWHTIITPLILLSVYICTFCIFNQISLFFSFCFP